MFRTAPRYDRHAAIQRVSALVGVTGGQDWHLENADATRIEQFCDVYDQLQDVDDRVALMKLIVASCDDAMRAGQAPANGRVREALARDYAIHFHTVQYWACLEDALDDSFDIAPLMREIHAACTPPLLLAALADDGPALDTALADAPTQGELDDALLGAAARTAPAIVQRLLAAGASPRTRDEGGQTPLLRAASSACREITRILLTAGSELDAVNAYGWTAAHIAALNANIPILQALLDAGANLHTRDNHGYDPLMAATEGGHSEVVDILLAHGARIAALNTRGEHALAIAKRHAGHPSPRAAAGRILVTLRAVAST